MSDTIRVLSAADADRMARLSEEVQGRLLEMSLITAPALGLDLPDSVRPRFVPHARAESAQSAQAVAAQVDGGPTDAGAPDSATSGAGSPSASGGWMEIIEIDGVTACDGVIDGQAFAVSPCGGVATKPVLKL